MKGIAEMFAEFGSADPFDVQANLEWWVRERRRTTNEASKAWSKRKYAQDAEYRAKKKQQTSARQKQRYATDPAFRAYMREYAKRRYYAKKQQRLQQAA